MATSNVEYFREAQPSQLSLFDLPPTQTAVEHIYYQDVRPISQLTNSSPIEFTISGQNGMEYIDMNRSLICVKARIIKSDGSKLPGTSHIGPVNLLLQALFTQVDVSFQNKIVSSTSGHYPYKAMIQTLLKYGSEAKNTQLSTQLWLKDLPGAMDDANALAGQNTSLYERAKYFANSQTVDMIGPIYHDLFKLNRYILNQVAVTLKFHRSKTEFCLMTDEVTPDYNLVIEEMVLKVCKVQMNPAVIYAHSQVLQKTNAKYPYTKSEVKMTTIPQGQVNFTWDNVFQGIRPGKVVIGFVNSRAVAGSYTMNPWNFRHYNLNQIAVLVDGIPAGGTPMKMSYDRKNGVQTTEVLLHMFQSAGKWMSDVGNQVGRSDIAQGFALYTFDLEPTFEEGSYLNLIKQGIVRIDAQFATSLPHPVTCIVYAEGCGYFELNLSRDVILA